ncbi:MAG TPA: hypothetical protein VGL93_30785 [Streptosporangiaceae bacterium]
MTRFIIRAVCSLGGFMVGTVVVGVLVGVIGLYGTLAASLTVIAGLAAGYAGFRMSRGIVARRQAGAYTDPGYPPQQPYQGQGQPYPPQDPYRR